MGPAVDLAADFSDRLRVSETPVGRVSVHIHRELSLTNVPLFRSGSERQSGRKR